MVTGRRRILVILRAPRTGDPHRAPARDGAMTGTPAADAAQREPTGRHDLDATLDRSQAADDDQLDARQQREDVLLHPSAGHARTAGSQSPGIRRRVERNLYWVTDGV